jgi:hypothetical protein
MLRKLQDKLKPGFPWSYEPYVSGFVHVRKSQIQGFFKEIQGIHVSANSRTNTEEKGLDISKIWRWIFQNAILMSFKQI